MYNNQFGFNPYYQPMMSTNGQQFGGQQPTINNQNNAPINRTFLNGKSVDSIDVVKATDIPLDGSVSYFPLADGSAIVTKALQNDGTTKLTIFKPVVEQKEEIRYITHEDMEKALNELNFDEIDDIKDEIKDLKQEFKDFKKNIKKES